MVPTTLTLEWIKFTSREVLSILILFVPKFSRIGPSQSTMKEWFTVSMDLLESLPV